MTINFETKLQGEYKVAITRSSGVIEETPWFHNTILDQGLDRIGQTTRGESILLYAQVGTGNTPPATTQTGLQTYLAGSNISSFPSSILNAGSPTYATTQTYSFTFTQGSVIGTIAEVGVGWAAAGNNLFSRELIRDGSGNPTTLSITGSDELTIFYRLTLRPVVTDGTGTVNLGSQTVNYTIRLADAATFCTVALAKQRFTTYTTNPASETYEIGATLNPITSSGLNGSLIPNGSPSSASTAAYLSGNYYNDSTLVWDPTRGNGTGGIKGMCVRAGTGTTNGANYQILFDTPIAKDNTKTLSMTFRVSWARG